MASCLQAKEIHSLTKMIDSRQHLSQERLDQTTSSLQLLNILLFKHKKLIIQDGSVNYHLVKESPALLLYLH